MASSGKPPDPTDPGRTPTHSAVLMDDDMKTDSPVGNINTSRSPKTVSNFNIVKKSLDEDRNSQKI